MDSKEFLEALWGQPPPGRILIWTLADKRSRYLQSPVAAGFAPGQLDTYTGVGLAHTDHGQHKRTPNELVCAIAGLWADIDVNGGPDNKTGAAPTWDDAYQAAHAQLPPTIIVHSGYGLQAWWLFDEPWRFTTRSEQRQAAQGAAQWQKLHRDGAGFGLDYTHDLARLLRLPGTTNGKGGQRRPVEVIEQGPRHERDELLSLAAQAGEVDPGYALGTRPDVKIGPPKGDTALVAKLMRSPRFAATWRHERPELGSMSEIDMALAGLAALAGYTDQQIADVLALHREQHNDPKGARLDYLQRTVARARAGREPGATPAPATNTTRAGTYLETSWAQAIKAQLQARNEDTIPLPFVELNMALDGGTRPGEVVLVAGYTSHGKSVFVDQMADSAAAAGKRVHLYLTEMTAYERGLRLLARRGVSFKKLKRRELDASDWRLIDSTLAKLPYGVSVVSDWSVDDVVAHIIESKWHMAVVDLIHGFDYRDERDLSRTSSAMVRAAKTGSTAIVYTAHLNDAQLRDSRSARRPMPGLHSIKGASSLKQDADNVIMVWQEDDDDGRPTGDGAIWIAKARQGGLARVNVTLDVASMTFKVLGQRERWAA